MYLLLAQRGNTVEYDRQSGVELLLVVPGGLFELVFLPIWLITKGLNAPGSAEEQTSASLVTSS